MARYPRIITDATLHCAAEVVRSYDTSVTLRQLYYRLVSEQLIPNKQGAYKALSAATAEARRAGTFPALADRGRQIHRPWHSSGVMSVVRGIAVEAYRLDRTDGQPWALYLGVEKAGIVSQLQHWFTESGVPVLALGGYASQTYADEIAWQVRLDGRPAVLVYGGDFDPSGEDIERDFLARCPVWEKVVRAALTPGQVTEYRLPPLPGKDSDPRAAGFAARHGELVQVELDALDPVVLQSLFARAVEPFWDVAAYRRVLEREDADRELLAQVRAAAVAHAERLLRGS